MRKNKFMYLEIFICLILFSITIWGCSATATSRDDSDIATLLPFSDVNNTVVLSYYPYCPGTKLAVNHEFCILIENQSKQIVKFPIDFGIKLFLFKEGENQWVEIQNELNYSSLYRNEIVLLPKGDGKWNYVESVWPELPALDVPVTVRVIVAGNAIRNGVEEPVGAYLDVTLEP